MMTSNPITAPAAASAPDRTDAFPSGAWTLGPLTISWSLSNGNEVDVTVSILGINVDKLSGKIEPGGILVDDSIDLLVIKGELSIESKSDGLYLSGTLKGLGVNYTYNHRIVAW